MCCSPRGRKELDTTERLNNKKSIKGALCDVIFKWKSPLQSISSSLNYVNVYKCVAATGRLQKIEGIKRDWWWKRNAFRRRLKNTYILIETGHRSCSLPVAIFLCIFLSSVHKGLTSYRLQSAWSVLQECQSSASMTFTLKAINPGFS